MKKVLFTVRSCILLLLLMQVNFLHAQPLKIGKNLFNTKTSALLELEDTNKALLLTRVANPATSIVAPWRGMIVFDSTRNELAYYDGNTWLYPSNGGNTNIYNTNGTLTNNRVVTMGRNSLTFTGSGGGTMNVLSTATAIDTGINIEANSVTGDDNTFIGITVSSTAPWQTTFLRGSNVNGPIVSKYEFNVMGSAQGFGKLGIYNGIANSYGFVIDSTNNIGLGTLNPISRLHVNGAVRADSLVLTGLQDGTSTDKILVIDGSNNVKKIATAGAINIYNADDSLTGNRTVTMKEKNLIFSTTTGKIGIGTSTPADKLSIGDTTFRAVGTTDSLDIINLGGRFNADYHDGLKAKLKLLSLGSGASERVWGFGVSGLRFGNSGGIFNNDVNNIFNMTMDYIVPDLNSHIFYIGTTARMSISNTGVGIGNNIFSASNLLHVAGTAQANKLVLTSLDTGATTDNILVIDASNNVKKISATTSANIYTADGSLTGRRTVNLGNNNLMFTGSGRVGINTNNPMNTFHVTGTAQANNLVLTSLEDGANTDRVLVLDGSNNVKKIPNIPNIYTTNGTLTGRRDVNLGGNQLTFTGSNIYVGFNTSANNQAIGIGFFEQNSRVWYIEKTTDNCLAFVQSGASERMRIARDGSVGIGTSNPNFSLDVNGSIRASSTVFTTKLQGISDERLKKDISPIQNALSIVLKMHGVTYNWRKDMEKEVGYRFKEGKDYGVIAQEIQKVLPELVEKDAKGYLTVDYPHITPVLIEAIKEQQQEIENLNTKLNSSELKTKQLEDRIQAQEKEMLELKKLVQQWIPKK